MDKSPKFQTMYRIHEKIVSSWSKWVFNSIRVKLVKKIYKNHTRNVLKFMIIL